MGSAGVRPPGGRGRKGLRVRPGGGAPANARRGHSRTLAPGSRLPAPGSRLPAPGSRLPAPGSRLPAPGSRLPAPGSRLPAPGSRLPAPGSRLPAPGSRLPAPGSRLPAPGSRLPAPGSRLPAPGSRLPAPGSRLLMWNSTEPAVVKGLLLRESGMDAVSFTMTVARRSTEFTREPFENDSFRPSHVTCSSSDGTEEVSCFAVKLRQAGKIRDRAGRAGVEWEWSCREPKNQAAACLQSQWPSASLLSARASSGSPSPRRTERSARSTRRPRSASPAARATA